MSWNTDPELFICYWNSTSGYYIYRIVKKYDVPLVSGDLTNGERLDFFKHLSFGNNKESDYDTLKSCLAKNVSDTTYDENVKFVNCQSLVARWDHKKSSATWSTQVEELTSIINSLPGIINPSATVLAEKISLENKISELVAEISLLKDKLNNEVTILAEKQAAEKNNSELVAENSSLKEQLNQEKKAKQALQTQVLDLATKLQESCGAGSGSGAHMQPWMAGDTVPSHWVPFDDLDKLNLNLSKNTHLKTIMEEPSKPKLIIDGTTNVQVNRFYRGTFIVAVNAEELIPDNEKARFDPEFWGLYKNADVTYAARKPLDSEM